MANSSLSQSSARNNSLKDSLKTLLRNLQRLNDQQAFGICHTCTHFQRRSRGGHCGLTKDSLALSKRLSSVANGKPPEARARHAMIANSKIRWRTRGKVNGKEVSIEARAKGKKKKGAPVS